MLLAPFVGSALIAGPTNRPPWPMQAPLTTSQLPSPAGKNLRAVWPCRRRRHPQKRQAASPVRAHVWPLVPPEGPGKKLINSPATHSISGRRGGRTGPGRLGPGFGASRPLFSVRPASCPSHAGSRPQLRAAARLCPPSSPGGLCRPGPHVRKHRRRAGEVVVVVAAAPSLLPVQGAMGARCSTGGRHVELGQSLSERAK